MAKRVYVELHVIQSVPPSCLNRDDTGSPKTAVYGGARRGRVSSQSWKKAMREYFKESLEDSGLGEKVGVRTKQIAVAIAEELMLLDPTLTKEAAVKKSVEALKILKVLKAVTPTTTTKPNTAVVEEDAAEGDSVDEAEADDESVKDLMVFMSKLQIKNVAQAIVDGSTKAGLTAAFQEKNSLDLAMFGRMIAGNDKLNVDGGAYVAHVLSTHKVANEYDFFTATDDLAGSVDEVTTGGHLGVTEFNSFTMYRHAVLSVEELLSNLTGDTVRTEVALKEFIRAFIESIPSGKQHTHNAYTYPSAVLITVRQGRRPVNLVDAFERPVVSSDGYIVPSVERMVSHYEMVNRLYAGAPLKTYIVGDLLDAQLGEQLDLRVEADLDKLCSEAVEAVKL